jgi:uncharacterized membrane protein YgcG
MKLNLDLNIKIGKWVLFSILVLVILYGSYFSLFGLREGFESGTCPAGCYGPLEVSGNCKLFNVEDGYNVLNIEAGAVKDSLVIPPGLHTGNDIANVLQIYKPAGATGPFFTCTYHDPGNQKLAHYGQFEFKRVDDPSVADPVVIIFPTPQMQRLFGLNSATADRITLTGTDSVYTTPNLNPPILPIGTKPTEICPFECDADDPNAVCAYDKDCANCLPQTICKSGKCPKPSPYPPKSQGGGGGGGRSGRSGGRGGGRGGGGRGNSPPNCSQAKCYEQSSNIGPNDQYDPYKKRRSDPKYDEDVGFCGVEYTDKSGLKFMFGCESTDQCKKLDCNTACKRDPKTKKFMGKCRPYPEDDSKTDNNDVNDYNDNNSGYNYYDADMDDYMNELMKPGKMTKNQMYNFNRAHYGCDASKYGCCADGFTFKKDASGNNCFDFLPYYNPILFRGGA